MNKKVVLVSLLLSAPHISANWWSDLVASSGASLSNLTCAAKKATFEMTSCVRSALADVDIATYTKNLTTEQKAAVVALALSLGGYAGYQGYKYCCSSPENERVNNTQQQLDGQKDLPKNPANDSEDYLENDMYV